MEAHSPKVTLPSVKWENQNQTNRLYGLLPNIQDCDSPEVPREEVVRAKIVSVESTATMKNASGYRKASSHP